MKVDLRKLLIVTILLCSSGLAFSASKGDPVTTEELSEMVVGYTHIGRADDFMNSQNVCFPK